jgi:uncharacterized membrane protein
MDDEEDELFSISLPPIAVFTVAVVIIMALYGAASAGRDIVMLCLKLSGNL